MRALLVMALGASTLMPAALTAQVKASERGRVEQTVDGTRISVDYSRPRSRGRAALFGEQVHWGEVWTPGANLSTKLTVSRDIRLNGHAVPAGSYSVWLVVKEQGPWTLLLDTDTTRFHTQRPRPDSIPLRFDVTLASGPKLDVLTWSFPQLANESATLELGWDTLRVPLQIDVTPSQVLAIANEVAQAYVGTWDVEWRFNPERPRKGTFTISYNEADSTLRAETLMWGETQRLVLMQAADGVFVPGFLEDGELRETAEFMVFEFVSENGRAVSFEARDPNTDKVVAAATRTGATTGS